MFWPVSIHPGHSDQKPQSDDDFLTLIFLKEGVGTKEKHHRDVSPDKIDK